MKKIICALLSVIMVLTLLVPILSVGAQSDASTPSTHSVDGDQIKVMSLNIRVSEDRPGYVSLKWVVGETESGDYLLRVDNAINEILAADPDVIGFQEYSFTGSPDVDTKLENALIDAGYAAVHRNYAGGEQNQTPIFYKKSMFSRVSNASGIVQFKHNEPVPTPTSTKINVQVVDVAGSNQWMRNATTKGGAAVKELFTRDGTSTYTATQVNSGEYLNLTNFSSLSGVTFNEDGTVTHSGVSYKGAYHTRNFVTGLSAAPASNAGKSFTWAVLQHTNGQRILMMSAHLSVWVQAYAQPVDDWTGAVVTDWRLENAKEILATAEEVYSTYGHLPTIVVGDFNARNNDVSYRALTEYFDDAARLAPDAIYWEGTSFDLINVARENPIDEDADLYDVQAFTPPEPSYPVDHIFCSQGDLEVVSYNVLNDTWEQCLISDHYALMTTFVLPTVATPASSHTSAIYRMEQTVTLTKGNSNDTIYYTLDGTDPTTSATRQTYNGAFKVYGDVQLRAVASRGGEYSLERTVNFATGAELVFTEFIKNNQGSYIQNVDGSKKGFVGELFSGFEVVNTSNHTLDLGRYTFWHEWASNNGISGDTSHLYNPVYKNTGIHLFVNELNTYFLEPGQTAFIWIVNEECYSYKLYYTADDAEFAVTLDEETGKVTYNTQVAKEAFELATGSTVDVDLIVPLDDTFGSYVCQNTWDGSDVTETVTVAWRMDAIEEKIYKRHANAINSFQRTGNISLMMATYNHEATAANAFASMLATHPDGYHATGSNQGAFQITNTLDPVTGKVKGVASSFVLKAYNLGKLSTAEQAFADNMVRDLSMRKVTWVVDGVETVTYEPRNVAPTTATPSKPANGSETFTFACWSPMPVACKADSTGSYLLATEATYVAQFYSSLNNIVASFYDGANNLVDVEGVAIGGGTITLPAALAGEGSFAGWKDASGNLYAAGASYNLTAEMTFTPMFISFTTLKGASIRTNEDSTGIRFRSTVAKADYAALSDLVTSVKYGTFIVPQSYVDAAGAFDISLFPKHLQVNATDWYDTTGTNYTIAGSVAKIRSQNYLLDYTACAYLNVTYKDGTQVFIYAVREENCGYKVYDTAYNAYNDRTTAADSTHDNQIEVAGVGITYSPYTSAELATIRLFMDPILNIGFRDGKLVSIADTEYYTAALAIPEIWEYNDALSRLEITAGNANAWSTVYACYIEGEAATITVNGAKLYVPYSGDSLYSDFY